MKVSSNLHFLPLVESSILGFVSTLTDFLTGIEFGEDSEKKPFVKCFSSFETSN